MIKKLFNYLLKHELFEDANSASRSTHAKLFKRIPSIFLSILIFAGTLTILSILIYRQKDVLINFNWELKWELLLPLGIVHGSAVLFGALAWSKILNSLGPRVGFGMHLRNFCINMVARRIPGTFWYVLYRGKAYSKYGYSFKITSLASGVELAVSLLSGAIVASVFGFGILKEHSLPAWILIIPFLISSVFLHPKLLRWLIDRFGGDPSKFSYPSLLSVIGIYLLLWICGGIVLLLLTNMFYPLPVSYLGYFISIWAIVGVVSYLFIFLPFKFGIAEVGLSLFLASVLPSSIAVILSVAMRVVSTIFEIFWALLFSLVGGIE